ncbi:MAG: AAA family ATPase [Planctomycetes bacterium]|nr:AAA family ATPase [Planctomycetota bacterium]
MTRPLRGLEAFQDHLERLARRGRAHHALLVTGMRGCGKRTLARALGRGRLCTADVDERGAFGCGRCGPCGRVDRGQHTDVTVVEREAGKTRVPVEALRNLVDELMRGSLEGQGRVAILIDADRLQREGQNALLKTLEEPAPRTTLILTAERPEALLDTVRSRCERVAVPGLSEEDLCAALSEHTTLEPATVERYARLARGSLGLAHAFAGGEFSELEARCRSVFDARERTRVAPQAFAHRVLEDVEPGEEGIRQAKVLRARSALRLVLALAHEAAQQDATDDPWRIVEHAFDALGDLDLGLAADIVLAGFFASVTSDAA